MNIVLIGYRGSGKTSVGLALTENLGWEAIDADLRIEQRAGLSIKEIFDQQGEKAFRDLESEVVAELALLDRRVLCLGGGAVVREENRRLIAPNNKLIWLKASAEALEARIASDPTTTDRRPNLTGKGAQEEIEHLLEQRRPIYHELADVEIETE